MKLTFWSFFYLFLAFTHPVSGLNLVFISSGDVAELLKIRSLVQAARQRSHTAVVFVNSANGGACKQALDYHLCLPLFCPDDKCSAAPRAVFGLARAELRKRQILPSVVLASSNFKGSEELSKHYQVPLLVIAETTSKNREGGFASLSHQTISLRNSNSLYDAAQSAASAFFAALIGTRGPNSAIDFYSNHHVITQGIPGLDVFDGCCPNIHPVGFFRTDSQVFVSDPTETRSNWQQTCSSRFVYASIATESNVMKLDIYNLLDKVANATNSCVLWHDNQGVFPLARTSIETESTRVRMTGSVYASPTSVLRGYTPLVVLSDKLVDVLHDAVFMESPMVYVGRHPEHCSQVRRAGVGLCASLSLPEKVLSTAVALHNSTTERNNIRAIRRMGFMMGGAQKALDIVELTVQLGIKNTDFFCDPALLASPYGYHGGVIVLSTFILSLLLCIVYSAVNLLLHK